MDYTTIFFVILSGIRAAVTLAGVMIITLGALSSLIQYLKSFFKNPPDINIIRIHFGYNLLLGLEFLIGADIINSILKPDYYSLGILAILVIIRIMLSYFLNKELEEISLKNSQS